MAATLPAEQQKDQKIPQNEPRWTVFSAFLLVVIFLDAVAITWYVCNIPESSLDHLHKTLTALGGWLTTVGTFLGIQFKVKKQPEWSSLTRQLTVILIVVTATVIIWFLLLPFHTLTVRVTSDKGPLAKATARISGEQSNRASLSDADGRLKLGGLSAATYNLMVTKQDCTEQPVTVPFSSVIWPGATANVNLRCLPAGVLVLSSEPSGAQVTVDDTNGQNTPREMRLSPGVHHISLQLPHYVRQDFDVEVKPGDRNSMYRKLALIPGPVKLYEVLVSTAQEGVQIDVDRAEKGSAPLRVNLASGEHNITARLGGRTQTKTIVVPDRTVVTFDFGATQ